MNRGALHTLTHHISSSNRRISSGLAGLEGREIVLVCICVVVGLLVVQWLRKKEEEEDSVSVKSLHVGTFPATRPSLLEKILPSTRSIASSTRNITSSTRTMTSTNENDENNDNNTPKEEDEQQEEQAKPVENEEEMDMEEVFDGSMKDESDWMTESAPARMSIDGTFDEIRERFRETPEGAVDENPEDAAAKIGTKEAEEKKETEPSSADTEPESSVSARTDEAAPEQESAPSAEREEKKEVQSTGETAPPATEETAAKNSARAEPTAATTCTVSDAATEPQKPEGEEEKDEAACIEKATEPPKESRPSENSAPEPATTSTEPVDESATKTAEEPKSKTPPKSKDIESEEEEILEEVVSMEEEEKESRPEIPDHNRPMSIGERRAHRLAQRALSPRRNASPRRNGSGVGRVGSSSPSPPPLRTAGTAPATINSNNNPRRAPLAMPNPDISNSRRNVLEDSSSNNNGGGANRRRSSAARAEQQIAQLSAQLIAHQEQTIQALQDLSQTMTNLMITQMKREKESDEDTKDMLNVDRATVRLDGLEVYAVVSALTVATAIACFDVYGSNLINIFTADQINRDNILPLFLNTVFLGVSGVGIIAGLHATLVFSLMTMYGRTAVGVSHDEAFVEFFVQTGRVRYRGFHTFRLSLYCFLVQVLFTITSKSSPILRPLVVVTNLVCMYWVYKDTQSVIEKAGDILFNFNASKQPRRQSTGGNLALQRTLSDMSGNAGRPRGSVAIPRVDSSGSEFSAPKELETPKDEPEGSGGGADKLANMRRRAVAAKQARTSSVKDGSMVNGRYSRKKGVARSKSGVLIYDVGPQDNRPARRGGRRPSRKVT